MPHTIETERLLLRPFTLDDTAALHESVYGDADAMEFLPGGIPRTETQTRRVIEYFMDHWEQHGYGVWAVVHKEDQRVIGQAGLNFVEQIQQTEVDYALHKQYWRLGLATEAARASCRYGFKTLGLTKITALVVPGNEASLNVIKKLGGDYRREVELWSMKLQMYMIVPTNFRIGDAEFILREADAND